MVLISINHDDDDGDDGDDDNDDGDGDGDVDDGDHLFWGGEAQKGRRAHGSVHSQADLVAIIAILAIMILILILIETFLLTTSDDPLSTDISIRSPFFPTTTFLLDLEYLIEQN